MPEELRPIMRVLAFDFGLARIGVASGQTITNTASPVTILSAHDGTPNWTEVTTLITTWGPDAIIIGKPLHMDGSKSDMQVYAEAFAAECQSRYNLKIFLVDERLSSEEVSYRLKSMDNHQRRKNAPIDDLAACVILETWLSKQ